MKNLVYILLFAFAMVSCEETIQLDLNQTAPRVTIEAQVTNRAHYQFAKVTWSTGFYQTGPTPRITNAVVTVTDDLGQVINFVHNPREHADSAGFYLPENDFVGTIGRTYTLNVVVNGTSYQATEKLVDVLDIDSLSYEINEDQQDDPETEGKIYEMRVFATEPQNERNFYLFKFFRNDTLTLFSDTDIYYSDDELLAEDIEGFPSPIYYGIGDKAGLEVYSLSRSGYVYYNDLFSNLNNDGGGMFGPIPALPRTNLSNEALGYFQVSAVKSASIMVE